MKAKNIGIDVKTPKEVCTDKKCPFHGDLKLRGKIFTGVVLAKDTHRSATIEWSYSVAIPKYERSEKRRTKIHVHNPSCIDAEVGDLVKVHETKPISKTKNCVIIENLGKKKGFVKEMAGREEATVEGEQKAAPKGESPDKKAEEKAETSDTPKENNISEEKEESTEVKE